MADIYALLLLVCAIEVLQKRKVGNYGVSCSQPEFVLAFGDKLGCPRDLNCNCNCQLVGGKLPPKGFLEGTGEMAAMPAAMDLEQGEEVKVAIPDNGESEVLFKSPRYSP